MKKLYFFSYLGGSLGGGALRQTQVNENFRALRPHNRADKLGYSGGPAWVAHK